MTTPADDVFASLDADAERRSDRAVAEGIDLLPYTYDDRGNGLRVLAVHARDVAWVPEEALARVWTGSRWEADTGKLLLHRASVVTDAMLAECGERATAAEAEVTRITADGTTESEELTAARAEVAKLKAYRAHITKSRSNEKLSAMGRMALSDPSVAVRTGRWDDRPGLLNVGNCTLVLGDDGTITTTPPERGHHLTQQASVYYDPDATAPRWQALLDRALPDQGIQRVLRAVFGLVARGGNDDHIFPILNGVPRSGKTTIMQVIAAVLANLDDPGAGYSGSFELSLLRARPGGGPDAQLYRILRKRFVYASEGNDGGTALAADAVKRFTGGDSRSARDTFGKAQGMLDRTPAFTPMLATNRAPHVDGADDGVRERLLVFPFTSTIPASQRDPRLPERLARAEGPGILRWLLEGYTDVVRNPSVIRDLPQAMIDETDATYRSLDIYQHFLGELTTVTDDKDKWISARSAWDTYLNWCRQQNEKETVIGSRRDFVAALKSAGHPNEPVWVTGEGQTSRRLKRLSWAAAYHEQGWAAAQNTERTGTSRAS